MCALATLPVLLLFRACLSPYDTRLSSYENLSCALTVLCLRLRLSIFSLSGRVSPCFALPTRKLVGYSDRKLLFSRFVFIFRFQFLCFLFLSALTSPAPALFRTFTLSRLVTPASFLTALAGARYQ